MSHSHLFKRLALFLAGLFVTGLLIALFFDIGPIDDSDLILPERIVDPAQNPYPAIREIEFSEEESDELRRVKSIHLGDESMDRAFVESILSKHSAVLNRFTRYAAMSDWRQDQPLKVETDLLYLTRWLQVAELKCAESALLAFTGDIDAAIESTIHILKFANQLHTADTPVLYCLDPKGFYPTGVKNLLGLLENHSLDRQQNALFASSLEKGSLVPGSMKSVILAEYSVLRSIQPEHLYRYRTDPEYRFECPSWLPARLVYKTNRTQLMYADAVRTAIGAENGNFRTFTTEMHSVFPFGRRAEWSSALSGNAFGHELILRGRVRFDWSLRNFFVSKAQLQLLRLRVAFEQYRLDHDRWPDDLDALVPTYLEAVPLDPMDGEPLRYHAGNRVIYSIGSDFIDHGGIAPDKPRSFTSHKEILIELEPSDPLPWPDFSGKTTDPE